VPEKIRELRVTTRTGRLVLHERLEQVAILPQRRVVQWTICTE